MADRSSQPGKVLAVIEAFLENPFLTCWMALQIQDLDHILALQILLCPDTKSVVLTEIGSLRFDGAERPVFSEVPSHEDVPHAEASAGHGLAWVVAGQA